MTAFIPPVIEDDPVTDPVPTQDQLEDTKAGDKTQDGSDENFDPPQPNDDKPKEIDDKPEPIETFVEEEADFPGGAAEMAKFINENIDYPQEAIDLGIKGRVTVRFVVEKDGRVSNVSVAGPLAGCKACDKAAVQVVEKCHLGPRARMEVEPFELGLPFLSNLKLIKTHRLKHYPQIHLGIFFCNMNFRIIHVFLGSLVFLAAFGLAGYLAFSEAIPGLFGWKKMVFNFGIVRVWYF